MKKVYLVLLLTLLMLLTACEEGDMELVADLEQAEVTEVNAEEEVYEEESEEETEEEIYGERARFKGPELPDSYEADPSLKDFKKNVEILILQLDFKVKNLQVADAIVEYWVEPLIYSVNEPTIQYQTIIENLNFLAVSAEAFLDSNNAYEAQDAIGEYMFYHNNLTQILDVEIEPPSSPLIDKMVTPREVEYREVDPEELDWD